MSKLNMTELMALSDRLDDINLLVILLDLNHRGKIEEFLNLIGKRKILEGIREKYSR